MSKAVKYNDIVVDFCGSDWATTNPDEANGGYGVAMMIAFIRGVPPLLPDFSRDLEIPVETLKVAYGRLLQSGMFSRSFNAKSDPELLGKGYNVPKECLYGYGKDKVNWNYNKASKNAWRHIAGIAAGFIERNIPKIR